MARAGRSTIPSAANPFAFAIEALMSLAPYDDPTAAVIEDFADPGRFTERKTQVGVSSALVALAPGDAGARFTGANENAEPSAAWAMLGRHHGADR